MVEYDDKTISFNNDTYNLKGLKPNQVVWHLMEMNRPQNLLNNLNGKYSMPNRMHTISLVEGTSFDALLVDDRLFRYSKLSESDMNEVQEYINKYAYATALLKLNECATILGSGLNHEFDLEEEHTFISRSYDKLLENVVLTKEMGRLVESIDGSIELKEGNKYYIRKYNDLSLLENWENNFNNSNINNYTFNSAKKVNDNVIVEFIDKDGSVYNAIYENTNLKLVKSGLNLDKLLDESNLVEYYKVNILKEYEQPFTIKQAAILSYEIVDDKLKLEMLDAYGNKGYVILTPRIGAKDFIKKYKRLINNVVNELEFDYRVDSTVDLLNASEPDIESISRIKGLERLKNNTTLSYKVGGFVPNVEKGGKIIWVDPKDKTKFKLNVVNKDGKEYNITYNYTGDNIYDDIYNIEAEIDEYDFSLNSDVQKFYSLLSSIGTPLKSYPTGISTSTRNLRRKEVVEESEGVQVSDIAPKVDQDIQLVQVKLRKRKPIRESVTKLSKLSEQDEFYGARGFIKDEKGRYHFGDYYINESGKVVHKSKLTEAFWNEAGEKEYKGVKISVEKDDRGNTCYIPLRNDKFKPEDGTQFFSYNEVKEYIDNKLNESDSIDPVAYVEDVLKGKEPQTEFDKLCVEYKNIFNTMCKYNTVAKDIYPGFDRENAEKHLSPEEYKKFKKYNDLYQSERVKLRQVGNKIEAIGKLNESVDKELDSFKRFIENKYNTKSEEELNKQLEEVTEEDVNEFCTDKFYDIETEEDLNDLNKVEEIIRTKYNVKSGDDESIYEPTEEDIEEMKYWHCDDPREIWDKKVNESHKKSGKVKDKIDEGIDIYNASPEEIDDEVSDEYYNKTQKESDPQKKFEYACYTAASQWMSSVTEETSKSFIEGMILPIAKNAYNSPNHSDEDYLNEIIYNLENERGFKFNFNKGE